MSEALNSAARLSSSSLNLEFLRKQAKKRLKSLRANDSRVKLADVLLAMARERGFASWRMLKAQAEAQGALGKSNPLNTAVDAVLIDRFLDAAVPRPDEDHRSGTLKLAAEILAEHSELTRANVYAAAVVGDHRRLSELLQSDPKQANAPGGVRNWPPLCYLTFSRFLRVEKKKRSKDFTRATKVLLDAGADPNSHFFATNDQGKQERETALYGACGVANGASLTRLLLNRGADPANPPDGESLYHATEFDDHTCLKLLLKRKIDRQWLSYCMGHMMDREDPAGLKLFLDAGADSNFVFDMGLFKGWRPLHFAINRHRSEKIIRMLLDAGADPNLPDVNGVKPYTLARRLGHAKAAQLLLRHGAKDDLTDHQRLLAALMAGDEKAARRLLPNTPDFTAKLTDDDRKLLPHVASIGNIKAVRLMLNAGFPIDAKGDWGGSAVHQAAWHGHLEVLNLLIQRGANLHQSQDFGGDALATAIHGSKHGRHKNGVKVIATIARAVKPADPAPYLRFAEELGDQAVIDALLVAIQPNPSTDAAAGLMKAITQRDLASVRAILKARPEVVNQTAPHPTWGGRPQPLHAAIETGDLAIFKELLKAGADINGDNEAYSRWSPLMLAVHWNRREMREELHRRKARVGLIEALMLGDDKAVKRILRSDPKAILQPTPNHASPLHFARTTNSVQMFLDAGVDPHAKDYYGKTAVQSIARRGASAKSIVRLLHNQFPNSVPPASLAAVGDVALLRRTVLKNPSIARNPAVLESAIESGLVWVVRWLLNRGADANARQAGRSKGTMLHVAAWAGHLPVVRLLVERGGADVNAIDEEHRSTPAVWARTALTRFKRHRCKAVAEYLEAVEKSRQRGSNGPAPKARTGDWKPIMDAAFNGDAKRVKALLGAGADPNALGTTGHRYRPLHRAIEHKKTSPKHAGHDQVVRIFLDHGADPKLRATYGQVTALQLAAMQEPRFVRLLVDRFQPLDIFHACVCCDDKRVAELLKRDKSLAQTKDENDWTPLHYCCASAMYQTDSATQDAQLRIAKMLLDAGADVRATFQIEQWPIPPLYHCCGQHDNSAVADLLLKAGANPCDNESVYHAADEGHEKCLALFERYVDPKQLAEECTKCLCTQMHWGRSRAAKWLLEHGADPNSLGRWGDSALHSAVKNSANDAFVRLLLKHGANPKLKNKESKTPIQLARTLGNQRIIRLLE